jgi:hypothetical protein
MDIQTRAVMVNGQEQGGGRGMASDWNFQQLWLDFVQFFSIP